MELIFASSNTSKTKEIKAILPEGWTLKNLDSLNLNIELQETGSTLVENALQKARQLFELSGKACFADDSGLEVDVLHGAPGVYSARYAGPERNAQANMDKLLTEMSNATMRTARFLTVIAYIDIDGRHYLFDGKVEGRIAYQQKGQHGFGYDPLFIPEGFDQTFGELPLEIKFQLSHRTRAFEKFLQHLLLHQ